MKSPSPLKSFADLNSETPIERKRTMVYYWYVIGC